MKKYNYFNIVRLFIVLLSIWLAIILLMWENIKSKKYDENVLFVVDVSNSMNVQDVSDLDAKVSRLDLVKLLINRMVNSQGNVNWWVSVFGNVVKQIIPVTNDTGTISDYLYSLNTSILPDGWTDWNSLNILFSWNDFKYSKVIILSDAGWDIKNKILNISKKSKVYFVGIWSKEGGLVMNSNGSYIRSNGEKVMDSYDSSSANLISKKIWAKLMEIDNVDEIDNLVGKMVSSSIDFSNNEIQILIVLLCIFIVLVL